MSGPYMPDFNRRVVIGNLTIIPSLLRKFLAKSHYVLTYEPEERKIVLYVNHSDGGKVLFEIRDASYENAVKLAEELGLKSARKTPLLWDKWNPVLRLIDNGSEDARALERELLLRRIPYVIIRDSVFGISTSRGFHHPPMWTTEMMLKVIREIAEEYKEQLNSTP